MTGDRWQQVWAIFEEASKRPREKRGAFVAEASGGDEGLRGMVEELLAADREIDSYLDRPLVRQGSLRQGAGQAAPRGSPPPAGGTRIGPYRLVRPIAEGGMGSVHLAVRADDAFERRVVIKLVRPDMESEAIHARLRTERQILANLDHPNIARLYDGGATDQGVPYFVLEYVEGVPIDEYCARERLSIDERLTLFRKVCAAVGYAHRNLVVHRDLKPSNILVGVDGEPKLLDFGIAKLLDPMASASGAPTTVAWHRALTPNYASPEQIGGKPITTATDVYSLGVLLYVLLTGSLPHRLSGRSMTEIQAVLSTSEPLPPSVAVTRPAEQEGGAGAAAGGAVDAHAKGLVRELAGDLDAIVLRALRSSPRLRYESVEQMAADIERHQTGLPVIARAGGWRYRAGKFIRRHRVAVAAAAAVATLLIGFAVAMAVQAARVAFERDRAQSERDKKAQVLTLILDLFRLSSPYVVPGEELTVRRALERSVPLLDSGLQDQPAVRAELLHTSGSILSILGDAAVARRQLEEALVLRRSLYGDDHPEVAATLSALAGALKELGDLDEAESMARRAVEISRALEVSRPADRIGPLNQLVSVLCYRSEYEAAEMPAIEALALARELGEASGERVLALEHLARIRSAGGDYRESVRLNREALALRRAHQGERHPDLIGPLNNLALGLRRLEELEAAQGAYEEALELQRASFGEEHANPALLNNLAGVRSARGDFAGAETLYREARDALARAAGGDHPRVYALELQIARMRIRQGAAAEAETSVRRLQGEWRPRLGDHWWIDSGTGVLGESLSVRGRCAEAEPLLVGSFERLVDVATERVRQDAFTRLQEHLERCGKPGDVPRFRTRLGPAPG